MRRFGRRIGREAPAAGGEDSFLDIVSNMVGILIILVMIAGVRVGALVPEEHPEDVSLRTTLAQDSLFSDSPTDSDVSVADPLAPPFSTPESGPLTEAIPSTGAASATEGATPVVDAVERRRYIELAEQFLSRRNDAATLQTSVADLNEQMMLLKGQAAGAQGEYNALLTDIARVEAFLSRQASQVSEGETQIAPLQVESSQLDEQILRLDTERRALAAVRPKATVLENIPTPLSKKVEGAEGYFAIRSGRISHVPVGEFTERVRGAFRSMRDFRSNKIDETLGPVDGYRFHFSGTLQHFREGDAAGMMAVFDSGEFIPTAEILGEEIETALTDSSEFQRKLALYLKETSTITLSVWPDSYPELRRIKQYLLHRGYTIALRPMPAGKNIIISPSGTASTTY